MDNIFTFAKEVMFWSAFVSMIMLKKTTGQISTTLGGRIQYLSGKNSYNLCIDPQMGADTGFFLIFFNITHFLFQHFHRLLR